MDVGILLGDVCQNRESHKLALELEEQLNLQAKHRAYMIDLADYGWPCDVPEAMTNTLEGCQGFIFVTQQHQHSYSTAIKPVLSVFHDTFAGKPVAVATCSNDQQYGFKAFTQLKLALADMGCYPLDEGLNLNMIGKRFDEALQLNHKATERQVKEFIEAFVWHSQGWLQRQLTLEQKGRRYQNVLPS